jgi:Lon-like ATP-dependent protease
MPHGQNLPWRFALQYAYRPGFRNVCASSRRPYLSACLHLLSHVSSTSTLRGPLTSLAPPSSSAFSTSPARRKDSQDESKGRPPLETSFEDVKEKSEVEREVDPDDIIESKSKTSESSSSSSSVSTGSSTDGRGSSASGGSGDSSGDGGRKGRKPSAERALQKPTVPEVYPQVMAIPIAKRPLFPGFYKAVTIRDPHVAAAIQDMIKRGQPYIGAFLFKDENADRDTIESMDEVHNVGVFAQITSAFPVHGEPDALTAVLYPHRRIRMSALLAPDRNTSGTVRKEDTITNNPENIPEIIPPKPVKEDTAHERKGDVVASFEEVSAEQKSTEVPPLPYEPTSFLRKYPVSLVNVL